MSHESGTKPLHESTHQEEGTSSLFNDPRNLMGGASSICKFGSMHLHKIVQCRVWGKNFQDLLDLRSNPWCPDIRVFHFG